MPNLLRRRRIIDPMVRPFDARNYGAGTLYGWWSADRLSLNDGDAVSTWLDQSGRGNNAVAGTAPVYKANIQNNKPGVLFTSASSQYLIANGLVPVATGTDIPLSVFVAFKQNTTTGSQDFVAWGSSTNANSLMEAQAVATSSQARLFRRDDGGAFKLAGSGTLNTSPHVMAATFSGTTGSTWLDGVNLASGTDMDVGAITFDRCALGAQLRAAAAAFLNGYLFEVLVYASEISTGQRRAIERALGSKWGIPVS